MSEGRNRFLNYLGYMFFFTVYRRNHRCLQRQPRPLSRARTTKSERYNQNVQTEGEVLKYGVVIYLCACRRGDCTTSSTSPSSSRRPTTVELLENVYRQQSIRHTKPAEGNVDHLLFYVSFFLLLEQINTYGYPNNVYHPSLTPYWRLNTSSVVFFGVGK